MERNTQPQFYKYLTPEAAKAVLGTGRFKWSTPTLFNDPFDNQLDIVMHPDEELMATQLHEYTMSLLKEISPLQILLTQPRIF